MVTAVRAARRDTLPAIPSAADERQRVMEIATDLLEHGLETSPHVIAKLMRRLNGDLATIREVAASITPAQRRGHRMLPSPLPLVPPIMNAFESLVLTDDDRELLLIASLCTTDRLGILVALTERPLTELVDGVAGELLVIRRGRFAFGDPRLRIWIHETASPSARRRAHRLLERVHRSRHEDVRADWHRARGALQQTQDVVPRLVQVAREFSEAGHPERAFRLAVEAAEHAEGAQRDEARLVAGAAAIGAGLVEEATLWLGSLFPSGAASCRAHALASLLIAEAHVHGAVPVLDPAVHRPRSDEPEQWLAWARAAALAAGVCAERGARSSMRTWLVEVREADARAGAEGAVRDPAVALCWLLSGEDEASDAHATGPFSGGMLDALRTALHGNPRLGLQILAREDAAVSVEIDPLVAGFEHSPFVRAYRAVIEVLLLFWCGDVATARDRLLAAAVDLPISLPFAGLGAVLARRLDLAVLGEQGVLARSLSGALPSGSRIDGLVDRSIEAYLAGSVEDAAADLRLWGDRGRPGFALSVPDLDEVGPIDASPVVEPPEQGCARVLRRRIRQTPGATWQRDYPGLAERARALRSPFLRGRVEALLGAGCVIAGDRGAGRRHLHAAQSLFTDSGADAWRAAVDERLARLGEQLESDVTVATVPITVTVTATPLDRCRVAWEPILTEREIEVAMLVVEGASNRELASRLDVSVRTIEVHVGRVLSKLEVRSRVELTGLAHRTDQHV